MRQREHEYDEHVWKHLDGCYCTHVSFGCIWMCADNFLITYIVDISIYIGQSIKIISDIFCQNFHGSHNFEKVY